MYENIIYKYIYISQLQTISYYHIVTLFEENVYAC
jgi:hypothetical protein